MAVPLFEAGIAQMNGRNPKGVAQGFDIIGAVLFSLAAGLTLFAASGRAAYMMEGAVRGVKAVTAAWNKNLHMLFDFSGDSGR